MSIPPSRSTLPQIARRMLMALIAWILLGGLCSAATPITMLEGWFWAKKRAVSTTLKGGKPQIAPTRSGGNSANREASSSNPEQALSINSSSCHPSLTMTFIIPRARAASVPGFMDTQWSACRAGSVRRGSTTIVRIPAFLALRKLSQEDGLPSWGFLPHIVTRRVTSSLRSGTRAPPKVVSHTMLRGP